MFHPSEDPCSPSNGAAARPSRNTRPLQVLQVCPSIDLRCGVGNFARNLEAALKAEGVDICTRKTFSPCGEEIVLVQHEFALYKTEELSSAMAAWPGRKALFAHSRGTDVFADTVDGFVSLCEGMNSPLRPQLVLRHPGWQRKPLLDRGKLKQELDWSGYRCVVGTNGFISPSRQFDAVLDRFLDFAKQHDVLVAVHCPHHASHDDRPGYRDQEYRLFELARRYPRHLRLEMEFLDQAELNRRLQACDLLWCWTSTPSLPYGSGTCSDQYGSGTRLVVTGKQQHRQVFDLPNAVVASPELDPFVDALKAEVSRGQYDRHDPEPLSWNRFAKQLHQYLRELDKQLPSDQARGRRESDRQLATQLSSRQFRCIVGDRCTGVP